MTQIIVFLYSYLIVLSIRYSGNGALCSIVNIKYLLIRGIKDVYFDYFFYVVSIVSCRVTSYNEDSPQQSEHRRVSYRPCTDLGRRTNSPSATAVRRRSPRCVSPAASAGI